MKKIVYIILSMVFICMAFSGCGAGSSSDSHSDIILRETPQVYFLSGEDGFMLMPTVTLYENGNARLSQPMISSLGLFEMGHYELSVDTITVSHGEGATVTFAVSDSGKTLTITSTNLQFSKVGSIYKYQSNANRCKKVDGDELTIDILREFAKKGRELVFSDFDRFAYLRPENDPDIRFFDVEGKYTVRLVFDADGNTSCAVERNSSGEIFWLNLEGSTGSVFDEFLGIISIPKYEPRKWLDYFMNDNLPWDGNKTLTLPEFPGVTFTWTPYSVTANGKELFNGMPIWNVFLADLTNDGKPELCATVSIGSGIVDTHVIVYDIAKDKTYTLQHRMKYDYHLSIDDGTLLIGEGKLVITQTGYSNPEYWEDWAATELRLVNGAIFKP